MKYDDASWHYGADSFPKDQPEEFGATHIGLFLRWCFVKGWAGQLHLAEEPAAVAAVVDGGLSGTKFLLGYCDGKFTNEDLNEEGNAFAEQYYGDNGLYLEDYQKHFGMHEYSAAESAHDFSRFTAILDERLRTNVLTKAQTKPWWKWW
jgi:hypothetical protein